MTIPGRIRLRAARSSGTFAGPGAAKSTAPAAFWRDLASRVAFGRSVRLADGVVPWHTFNLVGFGPVNFQACHSKYQSSRCQAETLSLYRCGIDLLG